MGLGERLREAVRLKVRERGARDEEVLLSLIFCLAQGDGHLCDVDRLASDETQTTLVGLGRVPGSRRVSEYLSRFDARAVESLRGVAQEAAGEIVREVADHAAATAGYVPVFADGTAIEVTGEHFEGAAPGYDETTQYWLHSVFVDRLWVSQRLHEGGVDVAKGALEQLEETAAMLEGRGAVWLRADNAYYQKGVVEFCQAHGWGYSISVTHGTFKQPLRRGMEDLPPTAWEWINDFEQAAWIVHKPSGWKNKQSYVVVRTHEERGQRLLLARHTYILCSDPTLPLTEAVKRHRGKQGQENAQKGPLIDLDLHHPPCRRLQANRAYYTLGQIAQILLVTAQYRLLPKPARGHALRTILRDFVRVAGKLVFHARRWTLLFSKTAFRLDWLAFAADRVDRWACAPS